VQASRGAKFLPTRLLSPTSGRPCPAPVNMTWNRDATLGLRSTLPSTLLRHAGCCARRPRRHRLARPRRALAQEVLAAAPTDRPAVVDRTPSVVDPPAPPPSTPRPRRALAQEVLAAAPVNRPVVDPPAPPSSTLRRPRRALAQQVLAAAPVDRPAVDPTAPSSSTSRRPRRALAQQVLAAAPVDRPAVDPTAPSSSTSRRSRRALAQLVLAAAPVEAASPSAPRGALQVSPNTAVKC
jgi:hypothetical protein